MRFNKGQTPWNKGKTGLQVAWNKGKACKQISDGLKKSWAEGRHKGMTGKKQSEKQKEVVRQRILIDNPIHRPGALEKMRLANTGENSGMWKGDDAKPLAKHRWVISRFGQPTKCEHCSKDGLIGKKIHWANKSGKYKRERNDWMRLCAKCHAIYDIKYNPHNSVKNRKLTNKQVKEIRESKSTQSEIAKKYNVHQTTIHKIKSKKTWTHL